MKPYGNFKKGILNIGEAPGEVEDKNGKPFQGRTGKLLQRTYERLGIDLFEDCININAVHCRPMTSNGDNRTPTNNEIDCCRRMNLRVIEQYKPKVIILLGNAAVYSLIGHRWKKNLGGITKWRGWAIPDQDFQCWVCPTFHPSFIERSDSGVEEVIWKQDLKQAFSLLEMQPNQQYLAHPFPVYKEPVIHFTDDLSFLKKIGQPLSFQNEVVIDFETTGLKPHGAGHRIICCSVAVSEDEVYVFLMPKTPEKRKPLIEFLGSDIPKIAANIKFESAWSEVRLGVEVKNWIWDTMIMSHILDNREGITSLAFQTYVNFGIINYKDETSPYLEAEDKKNGNAINKIFELLAESGGSAKLMGRCAMDSIFEFRLYKKQQMSLLPF